MAEQELAFQEQSKSSKHYRIELRRDDLHRNLGGGLPKNSLYLFEGTDGAGKSIVSQRIAYSLLLNNVKVTYISSELNTMSFIEQMDSIDYDIKYKLLDGTLTFIPMFPLLGHTKLSKDFLSRLLTSKKVFSSEVIIFDTLSFLMIQNDITQKECFDLINVLKRYTSLGKTILFNVDPAHLNETFLTLLRSVCDSYFKLEIRTFAGNPVRVINIQRFKRPMAGFVSAIPYKIEPGKGLEIEIASFD